MATVNVRTFISITVVTIITVRGWRARLESVQQHVGLNIHGSAGVEGAICHVGASSSQTALTACNTGLPDQVIREENVLHLPNIYDHQRDAGRWTSL